MSKIADQPDPKHNSRPCVQDMVITDLEERKRVGVKRYGTLLQPFNGRDALVDAYQEAMDLCVYLRQVIEEKDFNFHDHLQQQREWSERTFGPGTRTHGVVAHIRKELQEIEAAPADIEEWIDVMILAIDGAWRAGASPQEIIDTYVRKMKKNYARSWPDWRAHSEDEPIQHLK